MLQNYKIEDIYIMDCLTFQFHIILKFQIIIYTAQKLHESVETDHMQTPDGGVVLVDLQGIPFFELHLMFYNAHHKIPGDESALAIGEKGDPMEYTPLLAIDSLYKSFLCFTGLQKILHKQ